MSSIQSNIQQLQSELAQYPGATLIVVSKQQSVERIQEAIAAGATHIGESYYQEARHKLPSLPSTVTKHFIGRLQSNKIKQIVELFDVIQSVDSAEKLQAIDAEAQKQGRQMQVLLQVNISGEVQKGGVSPELLEGFLQSGAKLTNTTISGLMALSEFTDNTERVRKQFRVLKALYDSCASKKLPQIDMQWLSMGMTNDYQTALEEGSNMVRIGRKIFGERY